MAFGSNSASIVGVVVFCFLRISSGTIMLLFAIKRYWQGPNNTQEKGKPSCIPYEKPYYSLHFTNNKTPVRMQKRFHNNSLHQIKNNKPLLLLYTEKYFINLLKTVFNILS